MSLERFRRGYLELRSVLRDRVTGFPAFSVLLGELRSALDDRRRLGVLHLEITSLELVESLYGWQVLDRILQRVAVILRGAVGAELPEGTLLGINSVAGDRFVAFLPSKGDGTEVDAKYLDGVGRALRHTLEQGFQGSEFAGLGPQLAFRVGHALLYHDPFYRFERRVYAAIDEARDLDEQRQARRELSWGEELEDIIRTAHVDAVFQPVVELTSREVLGHEAFARGPRDSLFEMPGVMFALSNRLGVEADLDRLCRRTALRASAQVPGTGKLFVNVLPESLTGAEGGESDVWELVHELALEPERLVLEVSERAAAADRERCLAGLGDLRERGFGLALDDVGSGYGSQDIVEWLRPDYVKLDVSLVHDIHENLIKQELLAMLVELARQVGAEVIAEGVEREEEVLTLSAAGARYGQGYLFAVPAAPKAREH